jgi:serine/threonine protein kinase
MKCFNPDCLHQNTQLTNFCQKCGQKLLLTERYRAHSYLGEGGFGRTFIGVDQNRRNSSCVIKQFLPLSQNSGALQKCIQLFEQEAELLEKLGKHPQIPDLLAFFEQDGKLYLIQEYIEGQDLLKELKQQGRFNETKIKSFLVEMLPILDFIHNKSIIHRDIKPENIIRRKNKLDPTIYGQISDLVLIDFGVSRQVSATIMTRMGTVTGTPGYASPEQLRGVTNASSDMYSLAITAIRLLTGVFPEERNGTLVDEIFDHYNLDWVWKEWLSKNRLSISPNLAIVLDKMLADKPSDRFQSAQEVLTAIGQRSFVVLPQPQPAPKPNIKLQTSKANFTKLDQLLSTEKWKEADQETGRVMLQIMGRETEHFLTEDNCRNFPPEELRIIDQLWLKYSEGRFGFSVQKQIWLKLGGKLDGREDWNTFGKLATQVGWMEGGEWLEYDLLTFNTKALPGHLPSAPGVRFWWGGGLYGCEVRVGIFFSFL